MDFLLYISIVKAKVWGSGGGWVTIARHCHGRNIQSNIGICTILDKSITFIFFQIEIIFSYDSK